MRNIYLATILSLITLQSCYADWTARFMWGANTGAVQRSQQTLVFAKTNGSDYFPIYNNISMIPDAGMTNAFVISSTVYQMFTVSAFYGSVTNPVYYNLPGDRTSDHDWVDCLYMIGVTNDYWYNGSRLKFINESGKDKFYVITIRYGTNVTRALKQVPAYTTEQWGYSPYFVNTNINSINLKIQDQDASLVYVNDGEGQGHYELKSFYNNTLSRITGTNWFTGTITIDTNGLPSITDVNTNSMLNPPTIFTTNGMFIEDGVTNFDISTNSISPTNILDDNVLPQYTYRTNQISTNIVSIVVDEARITVTTNGLVTNFWADTNLIYSMSAASNYTFSFQMPASNLQFFAFGKTANCQMTNVVQTFNIPWSTNLAWAGSLIKKLINIIAIILVIIDLKMRVVEALERS